jgi:hypothetical protein
MDEVMAPPYTMPTEKPMRSIKLLPDLQVVLWNILLQHKARDLQPHNVQRLRSMFPDTWSHTDQSMIECIRAIQHYPGSPAHQQASSAVNTPGHTVLIARDSGVRSLSLTYLSSWLDRKEE